MRLLEEYEQKVSALRQALIDGENSGRAEPFSMASIIEEAHQEAGGNPADA